MTAKGPVLTLFAARALLGVGPDADDRALRKAYREAAKRAHPDRPTGDAALFRDVQAAYRLLQDALARPTNFPPTLAAPPVADRAFLDIDIATAVAGGAEELSIDGRRLRLKLPAGLRAGDKVRLMDVLFEVRHRPLDGALVRGDDLWLTGKVAPRVLAEGGRVEADTPLGPRQAWISTKAADRGLVRLTGQGLPARANHRAGDLFLRLEARESEKDSLARSLLRRFAAAWAA
ncbi:DnaJ domain-containing protein [Caulobacter segnis]|uniref:DnaJ domain-containing protein n=1 Tax=Caulobacter segnis TaxID=88688 RepID=UPI00285D1573|nr:DnaJ domain-containing protein [Caulobacter segnis]MDR6626319.1 curved DNA-binding protein [Caulobacter segnis]